MQSRTELTINVKAIKVLYQKTEVKTSRDWEWQKHQKSSKWEPTRQACSNDGTTVWFWTSNDSLQKKGESHWDAHTVKSVCLKNIFCFGTSMFPLILDLVYLFLEKTNVVNQGLWGGIISIFPKMSNYDFDSEAIMLAYSITNLTQI